MKNRTQMLPTIFTKSRGVQLVVLVVLEQFAEKRADVEKDGFPNLGELHDDLKVKCQELSRSGKRFFTCLHWR